MYTVQEILNRVCPDDGGNAIRVVIASENSITVVEAGDEEMHIKVEEA